MITLKTLSSATKQQVFDQVAKHMLTQRKRSMSLVRDPLTGRYIETCVYRTKKGLKCAAGCLIADDEYTAAFETRGWKKLVDDNFVTSKHEHLIQELQMIHDGDLPENWGYKLGLLADDLDLDFKRN